MDILYSLKEDLDQLRQSSSQLVGAKNVTERRKHLKSLIQKANLRIQVDQEFLLPEIQGLFDQSETVSDVALAQQSTLKRKLTSLANFAQKPGIKPEVFFQKSEEIKELTDKYCSYVFDPVMTSIRVHVPTVAREDLGEVYRDVKEEAQVEKKAGPKRRATV